MRMKAQGRMTVAGEPPLPGPAQRFEELQRRWGYPDPLTIAAFRDRERRRLVECTLDVGNDVTAHPDVLGIAGRTVPAVVYRPAAPPVGVLVWFHGGAFVGGSPALSDDQTRLLTRHSGCVVASVEYRLAPEEPFPAALDDARLAVDAIARRQRLGELPARLAVGGDSAGGNLAAGAVLAAARAGTHIDYQLLIYPVVDHVGRTASRERFAGFGGPSLEAPPGRFTHYFMTREDAATDLASPLRAPDLARMPPGMIVIAGVDRLRDECEAYARRMAELGVPFEVKRYPDHPHGFCAFAGVYPEAADALSYAASRLKHALTTKPETEPPAQS
jgi:acetyl esterase